MASQRFPERTFKVLLICTGNICRSAMAERVARAYLDEALGQDAAVISVGSAGTNAVVGSVMHPDSALVLAGLGGDAAGFAARQLVDDMAIDADLTLTMTRAHRRAVLAAAPRALSRTFTLREAAELADLATGDAVHAHDDFASRCRSFVSAMAEARPRRSGNASEDIPDPIGQPVEVHQEVGEALAAALLPLLERIVARRPHRAAGTTPTGQRPVDSHGSSRSRTLAACN